jgi:hypothetical protein
VRNKKKKMSSNEQSFGLNAVYSPQVSVAPSDASVSIPPPNFSSLPQIPSGFAVPLLPTVPGVAPGSLPLPAPHLLAAPGRGMLPGMVIPAPRLPPFSLPAQATAFPGVTGASGSAATGIPPISMPGMAMSSLGIPYLPPKIHTFKPSSTLQSQQQEKNQGIDPNNDIKCWTEHWSDDGPMKRKYWFNIVTMVSTYEKPFCLKTPEERSIPPCVWKEYSSTDGKVYYSNGTEST